MIAGLHHILELLRDPAVLSIVVPSVMLLVLSLISFALAMHRIHSLENELRQLRAQVNAGEEQGDNLTAALQAVEKNADKRYAVTENSLKFLNENCEGLIDQIQAVSQRVEDLHLLQEQFRNTLQQSIPASQSATDAARLLRQGLSVDEVAAQTAMPKNEVEMIGAVHAIGEAAAKAAVVPRPTPPVPPHPSAASASTPAEVPAQKTGPVASLRARNAYGIAGKKR